MTNRDVMELILCEATLLPKDRIKQIVEQAFVLIKGKTKIDDELADEKAEELIASLRKELPGVRRWLIEGRMLVEKDILLMQSKTDSFFQH